MARHGSIQGIAPATMVGAVLFFSPLLGADELPENWPESWKNAYSRFERYLEERAALWPRARLRPVGETGFEWLNPIHPDERKAIVADVFSGGAKVEEIGLKKPTRSISLNRPQPGLHALCMKVATPIGYQHVPPIVWFEVDNVGGENFELFGTESKKITEVPPPEPPEEYWPTERMLAWLDFHILPRRHPIDIQKENRKADPALFLQVDQHGGIHYDAGAAGSFLSLLRWQVFHDGRLKHRGPMDPSGRFDPELGTGVYVVLAGLEGPNGFLPLSNLLLFVLAPGENGSTLLFSQLDTPTKYPEWMQNLFPPPHGGGPLRFESLEELTEARRLINVWRGSRSMFNTPEAQWIFSGAEKKPQ